MSLLADFHKEQGLKHVLESEFGFVVYWKFNTECVIGDIYIVPEKRRYGIGKKMIRQIEDEAKTWGCKYLSCSSLPQAKKAPISQSFIISLGFKFFREEPGAIWYVKEI